MLNEEILIQDLDYICAHTNAQWLCCQDVYTLNIAEDEARFLKIFRDAGFMKKDLLLRHTACLEYGGGLCFNCQDLSGGGYVVPVASEHKAPLVFSGFETNFDQHTIYHECAHLYQRKYSLFPYQKISDLSYRKYLKEVHANTFASMVMLLRAPDVLTFKQQQLYCLAQDIQRVNQNSKNSRFYLSLPILLELVKKVRQEGRASVRQNFSKKGALDFEKIAFYTESFVKKYAYSQFEFAQIKNNASFSSYERLKQKAKAWRMLGERYMCMEEEKHQKRKEYYRAIAIQRKAQTDIKIKELPEIDEEAKILNAVCAIDVLNTRLNQNFNVYPGLDAIISKNEYYLSEISDEKKKEKALKIYDQIAQIHQKWKKNIRFKRLCSKIDHPDTRDEVWKMKFKKEKEIFQMFQSSKQY